MRLTLRCLLVAKVALWLAWGLGCAPRPEAGGDVAPLAAADGSPTSRAVGPSLLVHLPGIGGHLFPDIFLVDGLRDAGVRDDVVVYNWAGRFAGLGALLRRDRHDELARRVAALVVGHARRYPGAAVTLMGHSGGAGMVIFALERLPDDVQVDNVVLLAPALSPEYDLSAALARVRGKCFVFHSRLDAAILGAGTRVFGTMEGYRGDAAGLVGFRRPAGADVRAYEKVVDMPYDARWLAYGHMGDHIGMLSRTFSWKVIAPCVLDGRAASAGEGRVKPTRLINPGDAHDPVPLPPRDAATQPAITRPAAG